MKHKNLYLSLVLCLILLSISVPMAVAGESDLSITGTITEIEKYGHAVLDIEVEEFEKAGFNLGDIVTVTMEHYSGDMPYFNGYYVEKGEYLLRAYPGTENIAVCINYGNFAEAAGAKVGDSVEITLKEDDGALTEQEINNLVYSDERSDYNFDATFANFRPVVMGDLAAGTLYRSASPVNNGHNRAPYANELAELVGINTVMNEADTDEEIREFFEKDDFSSDYYRKLYEDGKVIALALPISFDTEEFSNGIISGLTFLSEQDPPYLVHCTEGKDRTGFAIMVLEALMGASVDEIIEDYMTTYENYYGIEPVTEKYDMIVEKNIMQMLPIITGSDNLEDGGLPAAAESYLINNGMTQEAVTSLKRKLSNNTNGQKAYTLEVSDGNKSIRYSGMTDSEYLSDLMDELKQRGDFDYEGAVGEYGLYITSVNNIRADDDLKAYWALYVNDEYGRYGADSQPVNDGDSFALKLERYE